MKEFVLDTGLCVLLDFVRVFSLWELCVINEQFYALFLVCVHIVSDVLFFF